MTKRSSLWVLALLTCGCSHKMPRVDVTIWAGDSAKGGITRAQENKTILATDLAFDDYASLTYTDLKKLYGAFLQCRDWGAPLMSRTQMHFMFLKNKDVITKVLNPTK